MGVKHYSNNWITYAELTTAPKDMTESLVLQSLTEATGDRGHKVYELSNHLGNVLATVSDKKLGQILGGSIVASYYEAQVQTASDYYPFGWQILARKVTNGESYRYSFNGVEQDQEWHGGQSMAFEFRTYDPRVGRFLSTDPLAHLFARQSPYIFADNSPIEKIDVLGLWGGKRKAKKYARENGLNPDDVYKDKDGVWRIDHSVVEVVKDAKGNVLEISGYVESKSFGKSDWASFWSSAGTRGMGLLQAGGGLIEMAGAATLLAAPEPTMTKVGAVIVGAKGIDDFATGMSQVFSGTPQQTLTYQGVKALTGNETVATGADIGTSLSGIALKSSQTATRIVTSHHVQRSVAAQVAKKAGCFVEGTIVITVDSSVVIDSIQLGQLVAVSLTHSEDPLGFNLLASVELLEEIRTTPIIAGEWKELKLELLKANGDKTLIEMLRPTSWVEENLKVVDSTIYISLPEMGSIGDAKVLSIHSSTVKLPDSLGSYRPVTGKFIHISNMVWELTFEGMKEPLGVTSNHPIWSNERQRWVEAGELEIGEEVTTQFGTTRLLNKRYLEGEHKVYNIEVHDAHNYFVSDQEILVHNICLPKTWGFMSYKSRLKWLNINHPGSPLAEAYYGLVNAQNLVKNIQKSIRSHKNHISRLKNWHQNPSSLNPFQIPVDIKEHNAAIKAYEQELEMYKGWYNSILKDVKDLEKIP